MWIIDSDNLIEEKPLSIPSAFSPLRYCCLKLAQVLVYQMETGRINYYDGDAGVVYLWLQISDDVSKVCVTK